MKSTSLKKIDVSPFTSTADIQLKRDRSGLSEPLYVVRPDRRALLTAVHRLGVPEISGPKERYLLLSQLAILRLFQRVRPRVKRTEDGLLPMLCLPRL